MSANYDQMQVNSTLFLLINFVQNKTISEIQTDTLNQIKGTKRTYEIKSVHIIRGKVDHMSYSKLTHSGLTQ